MHILSWIFKSVCGFLSLYNIDLIEGKLVWITELLMCWEENILMVQR